MSRRALAVTGAIAAIVASGSVQLASSAHRGLVVIPARAQETDVLDAYELLHAQGLRVALTEPVTITSLRVPIAARVVPRPGSRVPRGTVVQITPRPGLIGSPAVLKSHPHYRVPSFIGRSAQSAVAWAQAHAMFSAIPRLPPLPASSEPHLLDNYRVTAQRPRPGGTIVQGVMVGQGFQPTPLTVTVVRR